MKITQKTIKQIVENLGVKLPVTIDVQVYNEFGKSKDQGISLTIQISKFTQYSKKE